MNGETNGIASADVLIALTEFSGDPLQLIQPGSLTGLTNPLSPFDSLSFNVSLDNTDPVIGTLIVAAPAEPACGTLLLLGLLGFAGLRRRSRGA